MPLYACSKCDGYDNTALTNYWEHRRQAWSDKREPELLCSACDPEIGSWHGRFPRLSRLASGLTVTDPQGHLWRPEELASRAKRSHNHD